MKKTIMLFLSIVFCASVVCASDLSKTFSEKYDSLTPPENSSVHSDYLFEQIALSGKYSIMMLEQLNGRNADLNEKTDILIEKFDILIEQNKKIIKLLEKQRDEN